MFNLSNLVSNLCAGKLTAIHTKSRKYLLAAASDLTTDTTGCRGTFSALHFELSYSHKDQWHLFRLSLRNMGRKPLCLREIVFFSHADALQTDVRPPRNVFAFNDTVMNENFVEKCSDRHGRHTSRPLCLIYEPEAPRSFFSAQMTFYTNDVIYHSQFATRNNALRKLTCTIPCDDYLLQPGETISTDKIAILDTTDIAPRDTLTAWADAVNAIHRPNIPSHIPAGFLAGWLISTKCEKTDSQILRNMAAAGPLHKLGLEYAWISIDNLLNGSPGNWLQSNTDNFHDGVPQFLRQITAAGFKPGLWICPFMMLEGTHDFNQTQGFLQKKRDGALASRGNGWPWAPRNANGQRPQIYSLDSDCPETADYLNSIFATYAQWGVRYHMIDFLGNGFHDSTLRHTTFAKTSFRKLLRSFREHTAPDTFLISATGSSLANIGAFASARIGLDYGESRQLEPHFPSYPANYVINGSFGSAGAPNRNAVQNLAMWGFAHNRFFQCNSNMMTVDKPIPRNEAIIATSLFGISPSPVFFQDDFERMAPERLELLKKVLPRCPGMPEQIDLFTKTDAAKNPLHVFRLPVSTAWGNWTLCAIFNLNDSSRTVQLDAAALGLNPVKHYWLYDFWDENYLGTFRCTTTLEVPAMTCKVLRFTEKLSHPWILSTDFHVHQGQAELTDVSWDAQTMVLSGTAKRAAGEKGCLFVVSPDSWMERHFNKGLLVAKSALDKSLIIKVPITFTADTQDWKIEFAPII